MNLLESYKTQIQKLCEKHKVKNLYSFGSVNTTKFGKDSDIDLAVDFDTKDPLEYTDHYFDLKFELEKLLKHSIDLLESKAIRNAILKKNIDRSKVLLYGR